MLQNDVLAHQSTVEAVKKAGNDLIESSAGEEVSNLQNKLEVLNQRWQNVLEKTEQRKQQLDGALRQVNERINPETFWCLQDQDDMAFFLLVFTPLFSFYTSRRRVKKSGIKDRAEKNTALQFLA